MVWSSLKAFSIGMLVFSLSIQSFGFGIELNTQAQNNNSVISYVRGFYPKFGKGIHETITKVAIRESELFDSISQSDVYNAAEHLEPGQDLAEYMETQILTGLLFNDAPEGDLFPRTGFNPKGYDRDDSGISAVNGISWLKAFGDTSYIKNKRDLMKKVIENYDSVSRAEKTRFALLTGVSWTFSRKATILEAAQAKLADYNERLRKNVLFASHFGDLQYLHAMGSGSQTREVLLQKMLQYAQHAWNLAVGAEDTAAYKARVEASRAKHKGVPPFPTREDELFNRFPLNVLLYHSENRLEIRYRAVGSILHMIQDSFAKGHAVREGWEGKSEDGLSLLPTVTNVGRIRYLQDYAAQDSKLHGSFDVPPGKGDASQWPLVPGAKASAVRSAELLTFFAYKCSWDGTVVIDNKNCPVEGVLGFLKDYVFESVPYLNPQTFELDIPGVPRQLAKTQSHPSILKTKETEESEFGDQNN